MRISCVFAVMLAASACAPTIRYENAPAGTTPLTLTELTLVSSTSEFDAFQQKWPQLCDSQAGARICMIEYRGNYDDVVGRFAIQQASVKRNGNIICSMSVGELPSGEGYEVKINRFSNDTFTDNGLPAGAPLILQQKPDRQRLAALCRQ